MKKIYTALFVALSLLLVGCGTKPTKPEIQYVYETKIVILEPPASLYKPVALIPPPEKERFRDMTCPARENALTDLYILQNKQIATANQNLKDIGEWVVKQKNIHQPEKKK